MTPVPPPIIDTNLTHFQQADKRADAGTKAALI